MEVFSLVFWGVLVSRSLICSVPEGDCCFFSLLFFLFIFLLFLWACQASGGVLSYSSIGESHHAKTNRYKHKLYCTHVILYLLHHSLCYSFHIWVLSSGGSIVFNNINNPMCWSLWLHHYY